MNRLCIAIAATLALAGASGTVAADAGGPANGSQTGVIQCKPSGPVWVCFECRQTGSVTICVPKLVVALPPPNPDFP